MLLTATLRTTSLGGSVAQLQVLNRLVHNSLNYLRQQQHLREFHQARFESTDVAPKNKSLFLSHVTPYGSLTPLTLGMFNYLERRLPRVGFFVPIGRPSPIAKLDHKAELVHHVFGLEGEVQDMIGVSDTEAAQMIASGKQEDMMDRIFSKYAAYKDKYDFVLMQGPGSRIGGTELDAALAQTLNSPVLMGISGTDTTTADDYYNQAMLKRQVFSEHKVDVTGVVLNQVPLSSQQLLMKTLKPRFEKERIAYAGAVPHDRMLSGTRLDEVQASLGCQVLFGLKATLDKEFSDVLVASQRVEELLESLDERGDNSPPLVMTSMDRMDVVLALLAAQISNEGPTVSGVLLTKAGSVLKGRRYAKNVVGRIFGGLEEAGGSRAQLPVMYTDMTMFEAVEALRRVSQQPSLLPSSTRKIAQAKSLFEKYIDAEAVMAALPEPPEGVLSPKMFMHNLKSKCLANPQRIVLPESYDPRVLQAAVEVTQRGLARVTLLGEPDKVAADAKKRGLDLAGITVVDPQTNDRLDTYIDALVKAREKKGMTKQMATDQVKGDINMFGTMMVACGDADGMVSGAQHTTAATIRPAMQVLKAPGAVVSSVFFMCLPDKVLVYGDCAVNPSPNAEELAQIAEVSADTATAFGIDSRVAMLSYSTLGSGSGPEVQKVVDAFKLVKSHRPELAVEGPLQYDAAIDPKVAAVKVKNGTSKVAGRASVFIFPDLNTGNNTYKAVQQSTGAIAMGPIMQGLLKPVNDLSRGCTVPDIVNTICVTSIQAMSRASKEAAAK